MIDHSLRKEYDNGEIVVVWQPSKCIHSANCFRGLPAVFDPLKRPWVNIHGSDTENIVAQVSRCPSGALSYMRKDAEPEPERTATNSTTVEVLPKGPLLVHGDLTIITSDKTGHTKSGTTAFCRCGHSANKPYCDGSHQHAGFQG
ncbi:(4Fe-4S)-binding protein [Arundinibacter roseus]|uniref:Iron-binding zinc finger CDGSH type domain-containing protein n=1 Tax=Arundinibacter roseus TaxID=2070510 RepID=A0A4R4KGC7_9BACT|nr:(4Fe-4S)-binding protein [Arundinibacter roseus]TDB65972.1 hypothetical protein EZE20_09425 [Arundinibacter roseus]